MQQGRKLLVEARWDAEAGVWYAVSEDVPGLVTEAADLDTLVKRVAALVPELLEENAHLLDHDDDVSDVIDVCVMQSVKLHGNHAN